MRKLTRRRVWNVKRNPVRTAVLLTDAKDLSALDAQMLLTVAQLKVGQFDPDCLHVTGVMLSVCRSLARDGIGPEALVACSRADAVLASLQQGQPVTDQQRADLVELADWLHAQREAAGDAVFLRAAAPHLIAR